MLNINNKSWLERLHGMQEVVGSTPISSTIIQPPSPSTKGLNLAPSDFLIPPWF